MRLRKWCQHIEPYGFTSYGSYNKAMKSNKVVKVTAPALTLRRHVFAHLKKLKKHFVCSVRGPHTHTHTQVTFTQWNRLSALEKQKLNRANITRRGACCRSISRRCTYSVFLYNRHKWSIVLQKFVFYSWIIQVMQQQQSVRGGSPVTSGRESFIKTSFMERRYSACWGINRGAAQCF